MIQGDADSFVLLCESFAVLDGNNLPSELPPPVPTSQMMHIAHALHRMSLLSLDASETPALSSSSVCVTSDVSEASCTSKSVSFVSGASAGCNVASLRTLITRKHLRYMKKWNMLNKNSPGVL